MINVLLTNIIDDIVDMIKMTIIMTKVAIVLLIIFIICRIIWIISSKLQKRETYQYDSTPDHIDTVDTSYSYLPNTNNKKKEDIKVVNNPTKYSIIHKHGSFKDNMNYNLYSAKAIFAETNRKRTKKIEAFNKKDVIDIMHNQGFIGDVEVTQIPFPEATEAQKNACRIHNEILYPDMCKYDYSYYISRLEDNDSIPNPDLIYFATNHKIKFSYYIGKKALYNRIYEQLDLKDKIAFFAFCVYRFNSIDRNGNLDKSIHKDAFYELAKNKINNKTFITSIKRYKGEQLRFFGKIQVNGYETTGGSKTTSAYKETYAFLQERRIL